MGQEQPNFNMPEKSDSKNEKEIEIELADPKDSKEIYEVKKTSWLATYSAPEYGLTKEDVQQKDFFNKVEKLQGRLERGEAQSWVVKSEEKIVGFCTGVKGEEFNILHAFHILPEFQGRGIGKQLIEKVLEWLGDEKPIIVDVAEQNERAIHIYEKYGFVQNKDSPKPIMETFSNGKQIVNYQMIRPGRLEMLE